MDIAPELLNRIQNSFREGYTHNKKIASIVSKVGAGNGTGVDSAAFATEVGNELKKAFSENVQPDILPDERMYRNIAEKIFPPLLKKNHELINTVSKEVAKTTAQKEGLNLNGIDVPIDKNKIDGIVKHASNAPKYENVKKSTENSLVNYSQAVNDESVKKNAEFVGDSGVKAYIIRTTTGKCCEWCTNKAGKYEYGQEPKDIYRRHANCDCVVEYVVDGKSQNVHSKQWATEEEIEARKNIEPPKPTKEDVEKLKNLNVENGGKRGIIQLRLKNGEVTNPMPVDKYLKMKTNLEKIGVKVIQAQGDDLKYLESLKAEATYGHGYILHVGKTPSPAAMFEEIIHSQQAKKYGEFLSSDLKELAAREIYANRKLLKYSKAYGLDESDIKDTETNLSKWEQLFKRATGGDYNETEYYRGT